MPGTAPPGQPTHDVPRAERPARAPGRSMVPSRAAARSGAGTAADSQRWPGSRGGPGRRAERQPTATDARSHLRAGEGVVHRLRGARGRRGRPAGARRRTASRGASWARCSSPVRHHGGRRVDGRRRPELGARPTSSPADRGVSEIIDGRPAHADGNLLAVGRVGDERRVRRRHLATRPTATAGRSTTPEAMGGKHDQWAFDVASTRPATPGGRRRERLGRGAAPAVVQRRRRDLADASTAVPAARSTPPARSRSGDSPPSANGFVAVGLGATSATSQDGVAWFSPDGTTWEGRGAQPGRPRPPGAPSVRWTGNVRGGRRLRHRRQRPGPAGGLALGRRARLEQPARRPCRSTATAATRGGRHERDRSVLSTATGSPPPAATTGAPTSGGPPTGGQSWQLLPNPVHGGPVRGRRRPRRRRPVGRERPRRARQRAHRALIDSANRWQDATGDAFPTGGTSPSPRRWRSDRRPRWPRVPLQRPQRARRARPTAGRSGSTAATAAGRRSTASSWPPARSTTSCPFKGGFVAVGFEDFGVAARRQFLATASPTA